MNFDRNGKEMIKVRELKRWENLYRTVLKFPKDYWNLYSRIAWVNLTTIAKELPEWVEPEKETEEQIEARSRYLKNKEKKERRAKEEREEAIKIAGIEAEEHREGLISKYYNRFDKFFS